MNKGIVRRLAALESQNQATATHFVWVDCRQTEGRAREMYHAQTPIMPGEGVVFVSWQK